MINNKNQRATAMPIIKKPFEIGQTAMTRCLADALNASTAFGRWALFQLGRHKVNDWGEIPQEDWKSNDLAVNEGERIFSCYEIPQYLKSENDIQDAKIWIITERDRSVTTILFPSDY